MNKSAITPKQPNYKLAVEAGKKELISHFGEANLEFRITNVFDNMVLIATEHNGFDRYTVIEFTK